MSGQKKFWLQTNVKCVVPESYPYCPHRRSLENPREIGVKSLEKKYEAQLEFPGRLGSAKGKKNFHGGNLAGPANHGRRLAKFWPDTSLRQTVSDGHKGIHPRESSLCLGLIVYISQFTCLP